MGVCFSEGRRGTATTLQSWTHLPWLNATRGQVLGMEVHVIGTLFEGLRHSKSGKHAARDHILDRILHRLRHRAL
jgi:hypothetical protein